MEYIQVLISIIVIIYITFIQYSVYSSTKKELEKYLNIFPKSTGGDSFSVVKDESTNNIIGIATTHNNLIIKPIVNSINNYLYNNQGSVSDFHILKDIVDRNCESKEEEINTQIPIPIYYGLMGTMIGILLGVIFLMVSGGIKNIIAAGSASGIEGLLWGVGVAMLSSIIGIIMNVDASRIHKSNKVEVERRKNDFLSWIQAELLPQLSTDTVMVFEKVTKNLMEFNNTFSKNTQELKDTLSIVTKNTESQVNLIEKLNKLNIYEIASLNIQVYDKLKNSTKEIGQFATYLDNVNGYISGIHDLHIKLDEHGARTKAIEDMGFYFKEERSKMERWNGVVSNSVAKVDEKLAESVEKLKESSDKQINDLRIHTIKQSDVYRDSIDEQKKIFEMFFDEIREGIKFPVEEGQKTINKVVEEDEKVLIDRKEKIDKVLAEEEKVLQDKKEQFESVLEEIKSLSSIKKILSDLTNATKDQNQKLDKLVNSMDVVPLSEGTVIRQAPQKIRLPLWFKITGAAVVVILVLPNLINLIMMLISII